MKNLVFFDNSCSLCQSSVKKIQARDNEERFAFYPLQSQKAQELLSEELLHSDTLVLCEPDGKQWVRSKAIFRILQLLGGKQKWWWEVCLHIPGLDLFYRFIAHNRHWFDV